LSQPLIQLVDVHKTHVSPSGDVAAIRGLDLNVAGGEIFGVIGESGAGKSTLIRLINLLERPTSGQVLIEGEDATALPPAALRALRRRVGMIFQHFNLLSSRTVAQNVALPLKLEGRLGRAEIGARVDALLARVGLEGQAERYPAQLSGGQKQRVGIARALACGPKILLCDEATSALDPQTTRQVLNLLAELNRELGLTIVLITHEMEVVRQVCGRVAILEQGRIVEQGKVIETFLHPTHEATRRLLAERGDEVEEASLAAPPGARLFRLTYHGAAVQAPLLGRIARETGVDYAILSGRVARIGEQPYGQLTLAFLGGDVDAALAGFKAAGVGIQELRP
jgi:D-methionine transport system ATP-binding protein